MKLFYSDDWSKIYCGDSSQGIPLEDNSVQLVITSPPYNVALDYDEYNDSMSLENYYNMLEKVFRECYRVLVSGGRLAVNFPSCIKKSPGSKNAFLAIEAFRVLKNIGFLEREWIGWIKLSEFTKEEYLDCWRHQSFVDSTAWGSWCSPSSPVLRDVMEYILVFDKEKSVLEGDKNKVDITKKEFLIYTNCCWFILPNVKDKNLHPAPFPEELVYRLIKLYSYQENTILDPFAGIGTVGLVAKKNKRKSVLIDISQNYCELAVSRLSQDYFYFE